MGYTALYRKWRSKTFDEIKGQDPIIESFKNQVKTGRIGHAYLFSGTRGTGKTSVAKILARAVNCEHPVDGNPCNECESCRAILNESSMDVMELDAASNNSVEDIRQIKDQVQYPPVNGKYKVFIIDEVHMLSTAAFNAFLKTLEEPPEYVIFILATTEPNKIPVTILSRCQKYDFKRISTEVIAGRLREIADAEKILVTDEALHYIARVGDGSMRDAISLFDQCAAFQFDHEISYENALEILGSVDVSVFSDLFRALSTRDIRKCLEIVASVLEQGRDLTQFTDDFMQYVRNILLKKHVEDLKGLVDMSRENFERLYADARLLSEDEVLRYIRILSRLENQMRFSMQKRILLETTLIKLSCPETDVTTEGLNARLSEIDRILKSGTFTSVPVPFGENTVEAASQVSALKPKRVELPKAQYDDLMKLRHDWQTIIASVDDGLYRNALLQTEVRPDQENAGMIIAVEKSVLYNTLSEKACIEKIRQIVSERYHKDISFKVVLTKVRDDTIYVTDEDLGKINIEIEPEE